jgi:hypothetical protein
VSLTAFGLSLHRDRSFALAFKLNIDDIDGWEIPLLVCVAGPRYQTKPLNRNRFEGSFLLRVISGKQSCRDFANTLSRDHPVKPLCGTVRAYTTSKPTVSSLNYHNVVNIVAARQMS